MAPRALAIMFLLAVGCDSAEEAPDPQSSSAGGMSGKGGSGGNAATGAGSAGAPAGGEAGSGAAGQGAAGASAGASGAATVPPERCSLLIDAGPCDAALPRYAFDEGRCVEFTYGGCEGNENNFATAEACLAECGRFADVCYQCDADGVCGEALSDCSECPPDRDAQGDACTQVGLDCYFMPACGATDCTCTAGPSGSLSWECRTNACSAAPTRP
jgi:hypothetical protein